MDLIDSVKWKHARSVASGYDFGVDSDCMTVLTALQMRMEVHLINLGGQVC